MNIIIIGATSGIGHGLWKHYAAEGNRVAVIGRRDSKLKQMHEERPEQTSAYRADVMNTNEITDCINKIFSDFENVDMAIACAGIGDLNPELSFEKELPTIGTNVVGWTAAVDCIYNHFQAQDKGGHLVTITSIGGLAGEPSAPAYSATKAYQINYTKALQKKSRNTNIHVTEIRPGLVDTTMAKGDGLFWVMPVDKVVRQIAHAISRKKTKAVVTKRWRIISFLLKLVTLICY